MSATTTGIAEKNRRNALSSTGPKTAKGKAASSRNATKHGILSNSLVVAGENPEQTNALVSSVERDLALTGAIGQEISRSLVAGFRKEERLASYEQTLVETAKKEAEDLSLYEETGTIRQLHRCLDDARRVHKLLSGAEFKAAELDLLQATEFLSYLLKEIRSCPARTDGLHPAHSLIDNLDTEIRRQHRDGGDIGIVKAGLSEVAQMHADFVLREMTKLNARRKEKILKAKELAKIPSEKDLRRLERYQRLIHSSIRAKLEMAEKLRSLLKPINQPSGFVSSRGFGATEETKSGRFLEEGND